MAMSQPCSAFPASKLATARGLSPDTADSSLGVLLGLGPVSGNQMLDMLDWLRQRQPWIESCKPPRASRPRCVPRP